MKSIFITIILSSLCSLLGADVQDKKIKYDGMFSQIRQQREGISKHEILNSKSPFKEVARDENLTVISPETLNTASSFTLQAVMQDRVKMDGSWYKLGDTIGEYKITKITNTSAILKRGDEKQEIKIQNGKKNVYIKIN
ncbi:hypothetical protein [Campylobacter sp. 7477a]|uniref:hypothetical protein n=1 Tax=Campylobacter sp. 7477a TaxID=2735741 RepID=UPI0030150185|nr:hypothetical protein [Campylobacter sp. 7477a]